MFYPGSEVAASQPSHLACCPTPTFVPQVFIAFLTFLCLFVPTSPGSDNTQVSPFSHHLRRIVPSQYLPQPPLKKCATASPQQWPGTLCHWFTVSRQSVRQGGGGSRRCGVRRETARGATCPTALPHHQPPPCSAPGP